MVQDEELGLCKQKPSSSETEIAVLCQPDTSEECQDIAVYRSTYESSWCQRHKQHKITLWPFLRAKLTGTHF